MESPASAFPATSAAEQRPRPKIAQVARGPLNFPIARACPGSAHEPPQVGSAPLPGTNLAMTMEPGKQIRYQRLMVTLFHHPFCPHSRFVRLALGEYGIAARPVEERVWERREEFLVLNPACTTPVAVEEGRPAVPGASIIAEYLDETRGAELGEQRLLPREPGLRVEVRR